MTFTGSGRTPPRPRTPGAAKPGSPTPGASKTAPSKPATPKPGRPTSRPTEKRAVKLADDTAVRSWLRGLRLSGFSFVMMGILVLAVVVLAPSVRTYAEQRQQIDDLSNTVAAQQDSVDDLRRSGNAGTTAPS